MSGCEEGEDYFNFSAIEVPDFLWDDSDQNDSGLSPIMDAQTPANHCIEFIDYGFDDLINGEKNSSILDEGRETSQVKRRRQLFITDENDTYKCKEQIISSYENSWGEVPSVNYFNQSQEQNYFHVNHFPDDQVDILGPRCLQHKRQHSNVVQQIPTLASCRIFKGKKSYMKVPMKLTTSVAYPFSLLKPCGIQGEITLKDINQLIHSPSASSSNHRVDEDHPPFDYSPISGKPVVVKTKIHTEGGKGSITIMRTKG